MANYYYCRAGATISFSSHPDRLISLFPHDPTKIAILGTWGGHNRSYRSIIASPKLGRETRLWGGSCRAGVSFFSHGRMGRLLSSHGGWKLGGVSSGPLAWGLGGTATGECRSLLGTPIFIMYFVLRNFLGLVHQGQAAGFIA